MRVSIGLAAGVAFLVLAGCSGSSGAHGTSTTPTGFTPTLAPTTARSTFLNDVGGICGTFGVVDEAFGEFATNPSRGNRRLVLQNVVAYLQGMHKQFVSEHSYVPGDMQSEYLESLVRPSARLVTAGEGLTRAYRDHSRPEADKALRLYATAAAPIIRFGDKYRIPNCAGKAMPDLPID